MPLDRARPCRSPKEWCALKKIEIGTWVRKSEEASSELEEVEEVVVAKKKKKTKTATLEAKAIALKRKRASERREGVVTKWNSNSFDVLCDDGSSAKNCNPDEWEPLMIVRFEDSADQKVVSLDELRLLKPNFIGLDGFIPKAPNDLGDFLVNAGVNPS